MDIITLPNGKKYITNGYKPDDIVDILRVCGCSDEIVQGISTTMRDLIDKTDIAEMEFDSDYKAIEMDCENLRDALLEVFNLIKEYEENLENGKARFSRKQVFKLFEKVKDTINAEI